MIPEETLIDDALQGDQRAFRHLYDRHVDGLFRFMKQFSRDGDEVEDWVQRAFIKAYRGIHTFHREAKFSTWLFTIALNEMRSDRRKKTPPTDTLESGTMTESAIAAEQSEQADEFIWNDTMRRWLSELDETKRAVFVLYEVEGYSHAEIASMLNIGAIASRTHLHRAKRFLQEKWKEEEQTL
jgi:RNA polymerase sigma-70 factor (ECF subfamily)